jgi:hypothetical protein
MCAWAFADSFDCYAAIGDTTAGYWDSGLVTATLVAGRFAGSRAISVSGPSVGNHLIKSSAVNDGVHHFVFAITVSSFGGTANANSFTLQLADGATNQCGVAIRGNGDMALYAGTVPSSAGTTLALYTGAISSINTWTSFEVELVVHNTAGSITVRKNGNTSADFTLGSLNTRASANNYANKLTVASLSNAGHVWTLDDLFWRSDASAVAWMGDIRCYTRMPASDASTQFARTTPLPQTFFSGAANQTVTLGQPKYQPFTPTMSGGIGSVTFTQSATVPTTANTKCALYATSPGTPPPPTTLLASATAAIDCSTIGAGGSITFTFSPPVAVVAGTTYAVGVVHDASVGNIQGVSAGSSINFATQSYAAFPVNNPTGLAPASPAYRMTISLAPAANWMVVSEAQQDATTSYVYDSTPGDQDFYTIASIASTPVSTVAVTTRAYMQKSDAGSRTAAVQLKSGATTVASPTLTLTASGWLWAWRTDVTDPATGAEWTAAAVNNAQIGPVTVT